MAHLTRDRTEVNARIVFWGIGGAGVSTNLRVIRDKLRADHRGDLRRVPTALDPATHYELLPIELGQVNGLRTRLQIVGLPSGSANIATRKQLLDQVDGIVFVVDSQPHLLSENLLALGELRESLRAYGRSLEQLPLVVEYNKRDLSDPYTIEELHRRLAIAGAAVFEAVAPQGTGVLQTLTTISKRVIRVLRESGFEAPPGGSVDLPDTSSPASATEILAPPPPFPPAAEARDAALADQLEEAILADGDAVDTEFEDAVLAAERALDAPLDRPWEAVAKELKHIDGARIGADFELVSVGTASRTGARTVRVPLVLGNRDGETVTVALTVSLDPLLDGTDG